MKPRMLRQAYSGRLSGDRALDSARWTSSKTKPRPKPIKPPKDPVAGVCRWLESDEGKDGES